ncbi:hypothetical protein RYD26_12130 [Pasteurellaceae bacterium LIM206]|nr:hypothetical protein [Pasteurellaceae bacterium LIM206]
MKLLFNYLFYYTYKWIMLIGINIFEVPTLKLLTLVPVFKRNWARNKRKHRIIIDNPEYGFAIGFAFYYMLSSTILFVASIQLLIVAFLNIKLGTKYDTEIFCGIFFTISYTLNELLLGWHSNKYMKYFVKFDKISNKRNGCLVAALFHIGAITFFIISILLIKNYREGW